MDTKQNFPKSCLQLASALLEVNENESEEIVLDQTSKEEITLICPRKGSIGTRVETANVGENFHHRESSCCVAKKKVNLHCQSSQARVAVLMLVVRNMCSNVVKNL